MLWKFESAFSKKYSDEEKRGLFFKYERKYTATRGRVVYYLLSRFIKLYYALPIKHPNTDIYKKRDYIQFRIGSYLLCLYTTIGTLKGYIPTFFEENYMVTIHDTDEIVARKRVAREKDYAVWKETYCKTYNQSFIHIRRGFEILEIF